MAESSDLRILRQVAEIGAAHIHQRPVVTAFEIDVAGLVEAFVEDDRYAIGRSDGRNRADVAIGEERADLFLRGKAKTPVHDVLQGGELDPVRGRHDGQKTSFKIREIKVAPFLA